MPTMEQWSENEELNALAKVNVTVDGYGTMRGTDVEEQWAGGLLIAAQERVVSDRDLSKIRTAPGSMRLEVDPGVDLSGNVAKRIINPWYADEEQGILERADDGLRRIFGRAVAAQRSIREDDVRNRMARYTSEHGEYYADMLRHIVETRAADVIRCLHKAAEWNSSFGQMLEEAFPELMDRDRLKQAVMAEQAEHLASMPDHVG